MSNLPNVLTINVNDEEIIIDEKQYRYLFGLSAKFVENRWDEVTDINSKIIALFTIQKYKDAWDLIDKNLESVDYGKIKNSKYFVVNPEAIRIFKYLHEKSIIDDVEYSYYDILSGNLSKEFWDYYIRVNGCKNFTDICKLVNKTFNELENDNVPLVKLDEYERSLMDKYLVPEDKLDEFVYDKPAFLFDIETLYELIDSDHFINPSKVLFIISQLMDGSTDTGWNELWTRALQTVEDLDYFNIRNDAMLLAFLLYINDDNNAEVVSKYWGKVLKLLVNSKETPFFFMTVERTLKDFVDRLYGFGLAPKNRLRDIAIEDYLDDSRMALVASYSLCGLDTSNYEMIKFVQNPTYAILNKQNGRVLFGDSIYDGAELARLPIWNSFNDDPDYQYHEMNDFEKLMFKQYNEDMVIYKEFMYALTDLIDKIRNK